MQAYTEKQRQRFIEWIGREHGYGGEYAAWDERRNCFVEYGIHLAWCAWRASACADRNEPQRSGGEKESQEHRKVERARNQRQEKPA